MTTLITLLPVPKWVLSTKDLTQEIKSKTYFVDGKEITLSKRKRQVVDTLINHPIYCASTVRISDVVSRLKSENGIEIATEITAIGRKYYALKSEVQQ